MYAGTAEVMRNKEIEQTLLLICKELGLIQPKISLWRIVDNGIVWKVLFFLMLFDGINYARHIPSVFERMGNFTSKYQEIVRKRNKEKTQKIIEEIVQAMKVEGELTQAKLGQLKDFQQDFIRTRYQQVLESIVTASDRFAPVQNTPGMMQKYIGAYVAKNVQQDSVSVLYRLSPCLGAKITSQDICDGILYKISDIVKNSDKIIVFQFDRLTTSTYCLSYSAAITNGMLKLKTPLLCCIIRSDFNRGRILLDKHEFSNLIESFCKDKEVEVGRQQINEVISAVPMQECFTVSNAKRIAQKIKKQGIKQVTQSLSSCLPIKREL